jgi:hypothetical protein
LKPDAWHRAASFAVDGVAQNGKVFRRVGGDGVERVFIQVSGGERYVRAWRDDQRGSDQAMSSDDLVKFTIPAEFVTARVSLTPGELVYGFRHGWLRDRAVVEVALAAYAAGGDLPSAEEELALLLSDSLERVPELVEDLARSSAEEPDPGAVWLYLALAWLCEHR